MIDGELARRAERLTAERVPFVLATVVRARQPTSVRAGDSAIVLGDGTIEGFVGGRVRRVVGAAARAARARDRGGGAAAAGARTTAAAIRAQPRAPWSSSTTPA